MLGAKLTLKAPQKGSNANTEAASARGALLRQPPGFESAGGHFNPANARPPGHAGDMPNLHVPTSGALDLEVLNTSISVDKDKPPRLIHARAS